jgi:GNAT superfamily N-acetyltransferase
MRNVSQLEVRVGDMHDAEACHLVHWAAATEGYAHIFPRDLYPFPSNEMRKRWHHWCQEAEVLVAEIDGRIVGATAITGTELRAFFVHPEFWGTGAAGRLHDAVIERIGSRGQTSMSLWVLEANSRARRFYGARGWHPTGRVQRTPFPPEPQELEYVLELDPISIEPSSRVPHAESAVELADAADHHPPLRGGA